MENSRQAPAKVSEAVGMSDAIKGRGKVRGYAHTGRAAGVAMAGSRLRMVGGGTDKREAHQLAEPLSSTSLQKASK